jgi:hypothetical protein
MDEHSCHHLYLQCVLHCLHGYHRLYHHPC